MEFTETLCIFAVLKIRGGKEISLNFQHHLTTNSKTELFTMLARISQVGTSVGVIIPKYIASEGGFSKGTAINIEFANDQIIISKPRNKREGWDEAFAKYAKEGEDARLMPDFLDSEAIDLL